MQTTMILPVLARQHIQRRLLIRIFNSTNHEYSINGVPEQLAALPKDVAGGLV